MNNHQKLSQSLDKTLRNSDLQNLSVNLAEVALDSFLNEGVARDIPIIGSLVGIVKTSGSISDAIFTKKLIHFLLPIK